MRINGISWRTSPPGLPTVFDLSRNELHLDPLPEVRKILKTSMGCLNRYPQDDSVGLLMDHIAALHAVPRDLVVVGPGSSGVLDALLHAHWPAGGSTIFGIPTFDEYSVLVSRAGGIPVEVRSDPPGRQALDDILSRVDASTRRVIIAAPHNPSGAAVAIEEVVRLRQALPQKVFLFIDQAYAEFDETLPRDAVRRLVMETEDVVVLRSFSKAYGLAGLRIGYGIFSSASLAARVRSAVPMFSVNVLALTAAIESLRHQQQLRERVCRIVKNRKRLEAFLRRHDLYSGIVSQGNFVWLPIQDSNALFRHALTDNILLREYPPTRRADHHSVRRFRRCPIGISDKIFDTNSQSCRQRCRCITDI
jgi:histidinol-phosphate aminotransferase